MMLLSFRVGSPTIAFVIISTLILGNAKFLHAWQEARTGAGSTASITRTTAFLGTRLVVTPLTPPHHDTHYPWSMKLRVGILGLPNVGKSSLFNALARQSLAHVANFPFCTIDPTTCLVPCGHDPYLERLAQWSLHTPRYATMEWVDVAGLAKNAHRGEGLGNQFLGTLRDCTCLCHVVRAFEDPTILVHQLQDHDDNQDSSSKLCNPLRDLETIHLELILADLAHVQRRLERILSKDNATDNDQETKRMERQVLEQVQVALQGGIPVRILGLTETQQDLIRSMGLLTAKPVVYAFNVDEVDFLLNRPQAEKLLEGILQEFESLFHHHETTATTAAAAAAAVTKPAFALVCANVESQLSLMTTEEQWEYLESIGVDTTIENPSLCYQVLPQLVMEQLGYSIVYTGPGVPPERSQTTRAHLIRTPLTAWDFAGRIHRDIQKGFVKAQVIPAPQLLEQASDYVHAKELGILRTEGKEYQLQHEDVICIQWRG